MTFSGLSEFEETIYLVQWRVERTRGSQDCIDLDRVVCGESKLDEWITDLKRRGVEFDVLTFDQTLRKHYDGKKAGKAKR